MGSLICPSSYGGTIYIYGVSKSGSLSYFFSGTIKVFNLLNDYDAIIGLNLVSYDNVSSVTDYLLRPSFLLFFYLCAILFLIDSDI